MPTSRRRMRRLANEDGFTLFELLIAMAVTAVGLMALVSSFDHSRELVSVAEKTEVASHQAERALPMPPRRRTTPTASTPRTT
jgi:prepilin-type N-terminal cleavage/methylation domain-containing protein